LQIAEQVLSLRAAESATLAVMRRLASVVALTGIALALADQKASRPTRTRRASPAGLRLEGLPVRSVWVPLVDEPPRRTITRRPDEPRLKIGERVPMKEGVVGIVLAHYVRSDKTDEVHYVVELRPDDTARGGE
jgi:hypothetical protein